MNNNGTRLKTILKIIIALTTFISKNGICEEIPYINLNYHRATILNSPFSDLKDMEGWETSICFGKDHRNLMHFFTASVIGVFNPKTYTRLTQNASSSFDLEYYYSHSAISVMYQIGYYPIERSSIFQPYTKLGLGISGLSTSVDVNTDCYDLRTPKPLETFGLCSRFSIGNEIVLSNITKEYKNAKFSIKFELGLNAMTPVRFIDVHDLNPDNNLISAVVFPESRKRRFETILGTKYKFIPVYRSLNIGFVVRFDDFQI